MLEAFFDSIAAFGLVADRHGRRCLLGASKAGLKSAGRAAAIVRSGVAVVALLASSDDPIAAQFGDTFGAGRWALPPRLDLTLRRAAVARNGVAVVARLAAVHLAIAALDRRDARRARLRADVVGLELTKRAATIARHHVAVIALLAQVQVDYAVAAVLDLLAYGTRRRACVTRLDGAA